MAAQTNTNSIATRIALQVPCRVLSALHEAQILNQFLGGFSALRKAKDLKEWSTTAFRNVMRSISMSFC